MPRETQEWEVKWTVNHLSMLKVHGVWAVPRSGLIFTKTGEKEVTLTTVMPFMAEMAKKILEGDTAPMTPSKLRAVQREDFYCIAERGRLGGYTFKSRIDFIPEEEQTTTEPKP